MTTTALTADTHDATVADGIVLIDFWADWCGPCHQFSPVYEAASDKYSDITFTKVDTEDQRELAGAYGITSIPTLVAYRDGIPLTAQQGALPPQALESLIEQIKGLDMDVVRADYEKQMAEARAAQAGEAAEVAPDATYEQP